MFWYRALIDPSRHLPTKAATEIMRNSYRAARRFLAFRLAEWKLELESKCHSFSGKNGTKI